MKLGTRLVEERLRALAERGCSYSEAAAELGVGYHYVAAFAKRHGVSFKLQPRSPKLRVDSDARENEMRSLYLNGETLQQIGEKFGVTRERVRQILTRRFGMTAISGGQSQKTRLRAKIDKDKVDARCRKAFGCSYAVYKRLLKRTDKPTYAYGQQRKNAKFRGINWEITFYDWWKVWEQSGHWEERGRGGGYCMCRLNDTGPYAIDNVYIATGRENMRDYWVGRRNLQAEISA